MNNNNDLPYEDLCNLIALKVPHATVNSVDNYLRALYKVILRQLELHQRIHIKGFGVFDIKERKSGERLIYNPNAEEKRFVDVKPRYSIRFRASSKFDYSVNENNFKIASDKKVKKHNSIKGSKRKRRNTRNVADLFNRAEKRRKNRGLLYG